MKDPLQRALLVERIWAIIGWVVLGLICVGGMFILGLMAAGAPP
ncbi:MAG TPA: hypothetical protein VLA89_15510 [Gemmatimonadales bacterium]|nr:hypothetical protein [Gemmatimonadales bacterium]